MQRAEGRWPVRQTHRMLHHLHVADLAVRIVGRLAQRVLEPTAGIVSTRPRAACQAVLVRMDVLDRILDGDDVAVRILVAIADQRRKGSGFARAGAAAKRAPGRAWSYPRRFSGRQLQILEIRDRRGDHPQHRADTHLDEAVDAEAADARRGVAKLHSRSLRIPPLACRS